MHRTGKTILLATLCFAYLSGYAHAYTGQLKGQNRQISNEQEYRFYIKFSPAVYADIDNGRVCFYSRETTRSKALLQKLEAHRFEPVIALTPQERADVRSGRGYTVLSDAFDRRLYSGLVQLVNSTSYAPETLMAMAAEFEAFDEVEYCELSPFTPPPPPSVTHEPSRLRSPDYTARQWYREYNHGGDTIGVNIDYAWSIGAKGQGVRIADIEWGWNYNHEDLKRPLFIDGLTTTDHTYDDHGTAVSGMLYGIENSSGITGMVHQAESFTGYSEKTKGRPHAIGLAVAGLRAGDVLVYEMQTLAQPNTQLYVPADYEQSVWDLTKSASQSGIIIVAAAGNGTVNLDGTQYKAYMDRGDNGSIIVGAGTIKGRKTAYFSTYGSRVNVQGWGDFCVTTAGYGNLYNGGPDAKYTSDFSGTSSATPIVTAAVVAVQSYAKSKYGKILSPADMRDVLIKTGTPQGSGGHIGPLPNVQKAIARVDSLLGGTPVVATMTNTQSSSRLFSVRGDKLVFHPTSEAIVSVFNPAGRLVRKMTVSPGDPEYDLSSANLTQGMYFIRAVFIDGRVVKGRFLLKIN